MRRAFVASCGISLAAACGYDWESFALVDGGATDDAMIAGDGAASADGANVPGQDGTVSPGNDGATQDGNVPADAGPDGPCVPSTACLDTANGCGNTCAINGTNCRNGCGGGGGSSQRCRNNCRDAEAHCKADCGAACETCLQNAGCPSPSACNNAVN